MADEWNVIGWTAQEQPVLTQQGYDVPWKIPADIDIVTVTGEYHSLDGGIVRGYVEFSASTSLTHVATKATLTSADWHAVIGMDGNFSVSLPATDTTALTPTPFTYTVTVVVGRKVLRTFTCSLPKATPLVDINDLVAL